jgi:tRNA G18 (ribose-2'-O)-methylase SpoU
MVEITDIDDPRIANYKSLRYTPLSHTKGKMFLTEGEKTTLQLLKSDFDIVSVFAVEEFYHNNHELISKKNIPETQLLYADKSLMSLIVGFNLHSGVMSLAKQPKPPELNELNSPVIVLNGIINSENVGAIVRNCAAFGVNSIIIDKQTSSPYLRRAVRVSMGAVFNMNVFYTGNLTDEIQKLKESLYKIISAEITEKSVPITMVEIPERCAIIFGSESKGISSKILDLSDMIVHIPITDKVNSINVASASAVILSKIFEQKK